MKWFIGLCLLFIFANVFGKHEIYEGHSIYKVAVQDIDQANILDDFSNGINADVWAHALPQRPGLIMVAGEKRQEFEDKLNNAGITFEIEIENVKELIDLEEKLQAEAAAINSTRASGLSFDRILTYEEVDAFLEDLAATYPDIVTLILGGYSFEGRPIKYVKISTSNFQDDSKPVVFIESLIHAREWVTLPVSLYAIEKLVKDVQEQDLLNDIDWIVLPIVNPDGFVHTHDENRLWRKNRATGYAVNDLCVGVDLNRNFDVDWSEHSSSFPCWETFHGRSPFSEPETAIVREIVTENLDRMELFLDLHSFGSMILYGFGSGVLPPNGLILHLVGVRMATEIDNVKMWYNPDYIVGNVAMILYEASGSAQDYVQSVGVPLSYTFELPGHRFGMGTGVGFFVDPSFIEQAGFETWQGIKAGAKFARDSYIAKRSKKKV